MGFEVLVPLVMGALFQVAEKVAGKIGEGALDTVGDAAKDTASTVLGRSKTGGRATPRKDLRWHVFPEDELFDFLGFNAEVFCPFGNAFGVPAVAAGAVPVEPEGTDRFAVFTEPIDNDAVHDRGGGHLVRGLSSEADEFGRKRRPPLIEELPVVLSLADDVLECSVPAIGHRQLGELVQLSGEVIPVQADDALRPVGAEVGLGISPEVAGDVCIKRRVPVMDELERLQDAGAVNRIRKRFENAAVTEVLLPARFLPGEGLLRWTPLRVPPLESHPQVGWYVWHGLSPPGR